MTEVYICATCGGSETWVPTYCNFGHCAICFKPCDSEHECNWDGREHASYGPDAFLPGNVHILEND